MRLTARSPHYVFIVNSLKTDRESGHVTLLYQRLAVSPLNEKTLSRPLRLCSCPIRIGIMKKLLFIPSDNISLRISRSYYLAKNLARHFDLYFVDWNDVMDAIWGGGQGSAWNSFSSFTSSLARPIKIDYDAQDEFHRIRGPVAQTAFIRRLVGDYYAYRFMRWVNGKTLRGFLNRVQPDLVMYADGFFLFPWIPMEARVVADMQDDFDENRPRIKDSEIHYHTRNYSHSYRNYAVSQQTADRLGDLYSTQFQALPNGADFATIRQIPDDHLQSLRSELNLENKTIVSFIGTAQKYDGEFLTELAQLCAPATLPNSLRHCGERTHSLSPQCHVCGLQTSG